MEEKEEELFKKALKFLKETRLRQELGIEAQVIIVRDPQPKKAEPYIPAMKRQRGRM